MIIKLDEIELSHLTEFKGGKKELSANMFFDGVNRILKGCLAPGASIGVHTHEDSCEVIFIIGGSGLLYENVPEGTETYKEVVPGDCLYCPKGHTHSLINPEASTSDLVFYAVVPQQ